MKGIEVNIGGTVYPCSPTMGAMLRFKRETGREVTEINPGSVSDMCTYLWCCVASACRREGKEFDMPLMDFADGITPEDMAGWEKAVTDSQPDEPGDDEKKSL